jgi:microcystin-dependent protein
MATIFPTSPAPQINDEYQGYRYNGTAWEIIGVDLSADYPTLTNGIISVSAVPTSIARTESPTFTGTVTMPSSTNIGDVSHTEIQTLNGITHTIQDQINEKAPKDAPTFTGTVVLPSTTSVGNVTSTEIGYLDGVTGSIQTQIDAKTTATYVDNAVSTAVANVIDTAPSTLDTLNELAAALGDDPNFATTITNLIAEKISNVPGMISQYAGPTAPSGWLLCEGQEVLITTYQSLYNAITSSGTVFPYGADTNGSGGAGSTHFRIPNLKGKVTVGKDSAQTEFDTLGETGGVKEVTLTGAQSGTSVHGHLDTLAAPAHTHTVGWQSDGTNSHDHALNSGSVTRVAGPSDGGSSGTGTIPTGGASATTLTGSVTNSVSANATEAHTNLQPYVVINYIIRY